MKHNVLSHAIAIALYWGKPQHSEFRWWLR